MNEEIIPIDIVIIGGGIAGLWALNRLRSLGYKAILLESNALGSGQTIKSQGIIHGGIKYALTGILTGSSSAIETMPTRWKDCLSGNGEIDLHAVNVLSQDQLLWSTGGLASDIASFFASKALNSRVKTLKREQYPTVLQSPKFKGHVYRLEEIVLDTPSLIKTLATPHIDHIFKINLDKGSEFIFEQNASNSSKNVAYLKINSGTSQLNIQAKCYLLTAGEGNENLTAGFLNPPKMQRRPLQMVFIKFNNDYPFFAHCIDGGINPRITITTHKAKDGKTVWYVGGQIAEDGVNRTPKEQCIVAKKELKSLLPWLDLSQAHWGSFFVNRAEPAQPGGKRPETDFVETFSNVLIAWPTKLALSPLLADKIIDLLKQQGITPSLSTELNLENNYVLESLDKPSVALPPWDIE